MRRVAALLFVTLLAAACSSDKKPTATAASSSSNASSTVPSTTSGAEAKSASWTTWGHDAARSGMTDDAPAPAGLRSVWSSQPVDGEVYAQPLVVDDIVIVATENDSVYAFDATTGELRWQQSIGRPVSGRSLPCGNVDPLGITSTPVADMKSNRLFVVGMVQPTHHELYAFSLDTGTVLFHRPIDASGADPTVHNQRAALALANGRVYVPFGGRFGDCGAYKGRVVAIAEDGSGDPIEYAVRANREGGFWAPPGPAVDGNGTLLLASGNSDGRTDFDDGNAVVRLTPDLQLADEWAPTDWAQLNSTDGDVGTTSPVLLRPGRVFEVGKAGIGYIVDAAHMGGVGGELLQQRICDRANGGVVHDGDVVFVPCNNELHAVRIADDGFTELWTGADSPGPAIVAGSLVWVLDVSKGVLHALDRNDGRDVFHSTVGGVTHFSAAAAGDGLVFVAGGQKVQAFGN